MGQRVIGRVVTGFFFYWVVGRETAVRGVSHFFGPTLVALQRLHETVSRFT